MVNIASCKDAIRRRRLEDLRLMPDAERRAHNNIIQDQILALPAWQQARTIMLYMHMPHEVATDKLIESLQKAGHSFVVPKCQDGQIVPCRIRNPETDLNLNTWGLREPKTEPLVKVAPTELDFILVPGVAFDRQGNRIGHGGGYYDRFLTAHYSEPTKNCYILSVAFSRQIIEACPHQPFDYRLPRLMTEKGLLSFDR